VIIEKLYEYHNEWIKMVQSMGGGSYSEDIVQETYIKIHLKKYQYNSDKAALKTFMYIILQSVLRDYIRKKKKIIKIQVGDFCEWEGMEEIFDKEMELHTHQEAQTDERIAFEQLSKKINKEVNTWHFFDEILFNMYRTPLKFNLPEKISIRKLAKETGISWVTIFHTLKNCKKRINENIKEDYQTYKKAVNE